MNDKEELINDFIEKITPIVKSIQQNSKEIEKIDITDEDIEETIGDLQKICTLFDFLTKNYTPSEGGEVHIPPSINNKIEKFLKNSDEIIEEMKKMDLQDTEDIDFE